MHNVKLSILRPSLIAGPNPPGNLGAMIHGIENGKYLIKYCRGKSPEKCSDGSGYCKSSSYVNRKGWDI